MKKSMFSVFLVFFSIFMIFAADSEDVTNKVGLELKDHDSVVFQVYADGMSANADDAPIDKIIVKRDDNSDYWNVSVNFRVQVTSTHTIYLTLSTDGPLKLEGSSDSSETIDYSLFYSGYTYFENGDQSSAPDKIESINYEMELTPGSYVFGKMPVSSGDFDYTAKNFYHIGKNGYLNINDATISSFSVQILKANAVGKSFGTYSSNIYLTATTGD